MRTSIDFPDELFRNLKANAALQGKSLRDHVLTLIERGMRSPPPSATTTARVPRPVPPIPTVDFGPVPLHLTTNKGINEFLDNEDLQKHLNVIKYGRSSGAAGNEAA